MAEAWLFIATTQRELVGGVAAALRGEDGAMLALLAASLGALHALTPGHGKAALAAFVAGGRIRMARALLMAGAAAGMHVLTGAALYFSFQLLLRQTPGLWGRSDPDVAMAGYALVGVAGIVMIAQAVLRRPADATGALAITAGIGILPCPLTISVLGFTMSQSSAAWAVLVLLSLAAGIATTIGCVAVATVLFRVSVERMLARFDARLASAGRWLQIATGAAVIAIAAYSIVAGTS